MLHEGFWCLPLERVLTLGDDRVVDCGIGVKGSNLFSRMKLKFSMMPGDGVSQGIHLNCRKDYGKMIIAVRVYEK